MKKKIKLGLILTFLCLAALGITACDPFGGGDVEVSQQLVEVTRGDINVTVTGSGKLETSREARLTFGSAGKLDQILVEEGDAVKEGDVLARLDTSTLELAVTQAESNLAQAQLSLTQAELAVTQAQLAQHTAEYDLKNTQDTEDALKLALLNAQITLDQAERNLHTGITATDYDALRAELDKAQVWYDYVDDSLEGATGSEADDWLLAFERAKEKLDIAQANYDPFGRLSALGIVSMLATQTAINIAMTIGLLPITGMTLPFVSYGGSSLWSCLIATALLINVGKHRPLLWGQKPFEFASR